MKKYNGSRSIGEVLKTYRRNQGVTQAKLAEDLGISPQYVGVLERGEKLPALDVFVRIAQITKVSPNILLTDVLGTYDKTLEEEVMNKFDIYSSEKIKLILETLEATYKIVNDYYKN